MEGRGLPAKAAFPDSFSYGNEAVETVSYDPEGAKKLLEESGWKDTDGDGYAAVSYTHLYCSIFWRTDRTASSVAASGSSDFLVSAVCDRNICQV